VPGRRSFSATISALAAALTLLLAGLPGTLHASPWTIAPRFQPEVAGDPQEAEDFEQEDLDPETVAMKELYDEAHVAFLAGRFLDAAANFDDGYAKSGMVPFLFNSAVAWERAGKLSQAAERYAEYLVKAPSALDHTEIKDRLVAIKEAIAENLTEAKVKQIKTKAITVIETKPAKAEIRLDDPNGPIFAISPFRGTLPPGGHVVYVTSKGYKPEFKEVPNVEGEFRAMYFSLSEEYFLGHLELKSNVAGADVYLKQISDDKGAAVEHEGDPEVAVGQTPFSNQIPPGKWEVRVKKLGYKDYRSEVEVPQGKVASFDARLDLLPYAFLDLKAETPESIGAVAYLGEKAKQELCTLPCQAQIDPGEHVIVIKKDKKKTLHFNVAVAKSDLVTVKVKMEPYTPRYPAIITGVLMAGAAGTGVFFALEAKRTQEEIQDDLDAFEQIEEDDPRARKGKLDAIVADSLFGAAAVLGALTLFYLLREKGDPSQGEKEQKNLAIVPAFGKNAGGVAAHWRF
jgi:hypothetical protein